jgi:Leucine-rich repeat (LRR) protein
LLLRGNALTDLPASLGALRQLRHLDLRANRFVSLPIVLGELPNLQRLDVRWNKIDHMPSWVKTLEQRGVTVLSGY